MPHEQRSLGLATAYPVANNGRAANMEDTGGRLPPATAKVEEYSPGCVDLLIASHRRCGFLSGSYRFLRLAQSDGALCRMQHGLRSGATVEEAAKPANRVGER